MWAAGSADLFRLKGSFEGCISGHDSNISNRPYHKNCRCALHDKSRRSAGGLPAAARCGSVSFAGRRRSREDRSLALVVSKGAANGGGSIEGFGEVLLLGEFDLGETGEK